MPNVPIRNKVKRIMSAVHEGESYPETTKSAGLYILYIFFAAAVLFILALTAGLVQSGHYIGSIVALLAGVSLGYVLIQIIRA